MAAAGVKGVSLLRKGGQRRNGGAAKASVCALTLTAVCGCCQGMVSRAFITVVCGHVCLKVCVEPREEAAAFNNSNFLKKGN